MLLNKEILVGVYNSRKITLAQPTCFPTSGVFNITSDKLYRTCGNINSPTLTLNIYGKFWAVGVTINVQQVNIFPGGQYYTDNGTFLGGAGSPNNYGGSWFLGQNPPNSGSYTCIYQCS